MVETEAAYEMARRIVKEEGIFVGLSSATAMHAVIEVAKQIGPGTIATIFLRREILEHPPVLRMAQRVG